MQSPNLIALTGRPLQPCILVQPLDWGAASAITVKRAQQSLVMGGEKLFHGEKASLSQHTNAAGLCGQDKPLDSLLVRGS